MGLADPSLGGSDGQVGVNAGPRMRVRIRAAGAAFAGGIWPRRRCNPRIRCLLAGHTVISPRFRPALNWPCWSTKYGYPTEAFLGSAWHPTSWTGHRGARALPVATRTTWFLPFPLNNQDPNFYDSCWSISSSFAQLALCRRQEKGAASFLSLTILGTLI